MGSVAHLWNPRGNSRLRRYWVAFGEQISIDGESLDQSGVVSFRADRPGHLHARLQAMGCEFEEAVAPGNDIAVWINGLKLFIGVKAIDANRMLVAFGIQAGARVNVTLEAVLAVKEDFKARLWANCGSGGGRLGGRVGICQTQH